MRRTADGDQIEGDLLALVTHDLRTPLAVISGYATELRDHWDELPDAKKRASIDVIGRNGMRATQMLEEGLRSALAEPGGHRREFREFDLAAQVRELVAEFAEISPNRFVVRGDERPSPVRCDPQRNWHVLANLLANAVKFSPPQGPIEVELARRGQFAAVSVRDHGAGISPARIRAIFRRRTGDVARRAAGLGIGLHLTRRIVEEQGGQMSVSSRAGRGSTFTYSLPVAPRRDGR
jgi:signal transduction histidine kinase